jgi:DNA mismatch endonuclease (patch repair protein)
MNNWFKKGHYQEPWNKGKKGYQNRGSFRKGHIPWNKGKHLSKEHIRKTADKHRKDFASKEQLEQLYWKEKLTISEIAKKFSVCEATIWNRMRQFEIPTRRAADVLRGRKRPPFSEEWRRKISEAHKGKPPFSKMSEEVKAKLSKLAKARMKDPEYRMKVFTEERRRKIHNWRINQKIPKKDTSIEVLFNEELERQQIKGFEKHHSVENICQADFVFSNEKIAVFCDGCYWHGCPVHFPERKEVQERDQMITKKLRKHGWTVLRFWEHEINEDVEKCVEEVRRVISG